MSIDQLILKAIEQSVKETVEKQLPRIHHEVEAAIRDQIGGIAARVLQRFAIEPYGQQQIKIIVDFRNVDEFGKL